MKRMVCILAFFSRALLSWAQETVPAEQLDQLKSQYSSTELIATTYASAFQYKLVDGKPAVSEREDTDYLPLVSGVAHVDRVYFNDNSAIVYHSIKNAKGKRVAPDKYCGHQETEEVFYSDTQLCAYRFAMPMAGSPTRVSSEKVYHDARYLTKVFFHRGMPVLRREVVFKVPEWADVQLMEVNFEGYAIQKNDSVADGMRVYTYTMEDLPAQKLEENSRSPLYTYPHILVLTKAYTLGGKTQKVLSSTDDLYAWYADLVEKVDNDQSSLRPIVDRITQSMTREEDKIRAIYYWVQDHIKYIAFEDGIAAFKPQNAQTVLANRYGDCKGMANLAKEMLKIAGFDARLAWLGTNMIPYSYDVPSLAVDNHMVCALDYQGQRYILDPTEKFSAFGKYADRIQGKELLIENGQAYIRGRVPATLKEDNLVARQEELAIESDELVGEGELRIHGSAKQQIYYLAQNIKADKKERLWRRLAVSDFGNADRVNLRKAPEMNREKPLSLDYDYRLGNKINRFGDEIYVDLDFEKSYQDMEIAEDWVGDYDFKKKVYDKSVKKLKLPEGYRVHHLPKSFEKTHADFSVKVAFTAREGYVHYQRTLIVEQGVVKNEHFETWNGFIKALGESYNDQIVLQRIN